MKEDVRANEGNCRDVTPWRLTPSYRDIIILKHVICNVRKRLFQCAGNVRGETPRCDVSTNPFIRPNILLHPLAPPLWGGREGLLFYFLLQNSVRKNFRFSAFFLLRKSRKALTADGRHACFDAFSSRHIPARPLRLVRSEENGGFLLAVFVLKSYRFAAVRPSRGCGGGLVVLQRGPRCNAAEAPLQSREGLTGPHPGPPQGEGELTSFVCNYE